MRPETQLRQLAANDDPALARVRAAIRLLAGVTAISLVAAGLFLYLQIANAADFDGRVVRVHDGDTLTVLVDRTQIRVRLVDIDAPELHQAFGRRSRESLASMCAGQVAHVAEQGTDRYRRTLGRITCGPFEANAEQVRRGMAWVYVRYAPKHSSLYGLQSEARMERRGLWADPQPVPPWEWRKAQHRRGHPR